jgi:hypothetical protein
MIKLIVVNVLLFVLCIVVFIFMAAGIGYALGPGKHVVVTALVYLVLVATHLLINYRLLKKWQLDSPASGLGSMILIACCYIIYLIYLLSN